MSLNSIISEKEADNSLDLHIDVNQALLVEALKKEKKELDDLTRIYEAVCGLKFFKNLFADADTNQKSEVLLKLCANIKYEFIGVGKFVFRQDDPSNDKFYVILSGEVGILTNANYSDVYARDREVYEKTTRLTQGKLPSQLSLGSINSLTQLDTTPKNDLEDIVDDYKTQYNIRNTFKNTLIMNKDTKGTSLLTLGKSTRLLTNSAKGLIKDKLKTMQIKSKKSLNELKEEDDDEDVVADEGEGKERDPNDLAEFKFFAGRFGHLVRILGKGAEFGDAALKSPGKKRSASILCKTDCEFLVINAQTYNDFIKKKSELKSEFLMKSFSFLSSVSSSQIKNKITYAFFGEGFSEGQILMEEGVILKRPKLYLIEYGECKLQRKHVISVKSPFHSDDILKEDVHWLTICTVGPGALLGEEILEQKRHQECYHYRVTVTSSRLSVLSIYKSTFTKIHTELEDQTRIYYEIKRKQREEIYAQMVAELESKRKNLHKEEQFLGKHASMARIINKSTINTFNQRVMREAKSLLKENSKIYPTLSSPTNKSDYSLLPVSTSHTTRPETARVGAKSPLFRSFRNEATTSSNILTDNQQFQEPVAVKSEQLSVLPLNSVPVMAAKAFKSPKSELQGEVRSFALGIDTTPSAESMNFRITKNKSLFFASKSPQSRTQTTHDDHESPANQKSNCKDELMIITQQEKHSHERCHVKKFARKSIDKRQRIRVEGEPEDTFESLRDSKQDVCHMDFLAHAPLEMLDQNQVENFKFVFSEDKESRVRQINKQRHLRKGVFGEVSKLNYLQHEHKLGNSLKSRLSRVKTLVVGSDEKIAHNITYTTPTSIPFTERPNTSLHSNFYLSPRRFANSPMSRPITSVGPISEHKKKHGKLSFNFAEFSREAEISSRGGAGNTLVGDDILQLQESNNRESCLELGDDPFSSPVPVTRESGREKLAKELKTKNPMYQNLILKNMVQKKLNHKRLSSQLSKRSVGKSDKMHETTLSLNSFRIPLDFKTTQSSFKDI